MSKNKMTTVVDIVIPVYGRFDLLKQCLDSIPAACDGLEYNVIVVDNASPKEEGKLPDGNYIVIQNKQNLGFPKACNIGAKRKQSPFILFLNSDVVLTKDAVVSMVNLMGSDPKIGIVGSKLLFPKTPSGPEGTVQHVGLYTDIKTNVKHLYIGWSPDNPRVQEVSEVLAVTGASMMVRRSVWNRIGGFDEAYGLGTYEDVDLCLAARLNGYRVLVDQFSVGTHFTGATSMKYKMGFPLNQNHLYFINKWQNKLPWTEYLHA